MRFVLFALFLVAFSNYAYCNENRVYCARIRPTNIHLKVSAAHLSWGKWIFHPPRYGEIGSPVGKATVPHGEIRVCSAGRQMSAAGTTGEIQLAKPDGQHVLTIRWTLQWLQASPSYDKVYNENQYRVSRSSGDYGHIFTVTEL